MEAVDPATEAVLEYAKKALRKSYEKGKLLYSQAAAASLPSSRKKFDKLPKIVTSVNRQAEDSGVTRASKHDQPSPASASKQSPSVPSSISTPGPKSRNAATQTPEHISTRVTHSGGTLESSPRRALSMSLMDPATTMPKVPLLASTPHKGEPSPRSAQSSRSHETLQQSQIAADASPWLRSLLEQLSPYPSVTQTPPGQQGGNSAQTPTHSYNASTISPYYPPRPQQQEKQSFRHDPAQSASASLAMVEPLPRRSSVTVIVGPLSTRFQRQSQVFKMGDIKANQAFVVLSLALELMEQVVNDPLLKSSWTEFEMMVINQLGDMDGLWK
ncbi:hypothetical protein J7T55_011813 [Diaporthe amygdali]|uniref:uncharacterized protein n=1 Tax=Phomopsis amygdali TaxID=1214568 RepID=UPI0022FEBF7B|nr:uncharacterized protein J7T55_011813 [Diaporthe amygdali]KAJ0123348.1 hypothetical protein J7T55_011813 [Diaporthe amygdali]